MGEHSEYISEIMEKVIKQKKVVVFGKGDLAIKICEWIIKSDDYSLEMIVPVVPEPQWSQSLISFAKKRNIRYLVSGDYRDIKLEKFDLGISIFYDKIFDEKFIMKIEKFINIHNSLLPKYRGVRPINWALKNHEKSHGVTIHEILPGVDNGPIISQVSYAIDPISEEVEDVYKKALGYAWMLFKKTMPDLYNIKPKNQDKDKATYYGSNVISRLGDRESIRRTKAH